MPYLILLQRLLLYNESFLQNEKYKQGDGTSKKKLGTDVNVDETSSDSSDEDESPSALNYRTPMLTQVQLLINVAKYSIASQFYVHSSS